jgi:hypothetical protein
VEEDERADLVVPDTKIFDYIRNSAHLVAVDLGGKRIAPAFQSEP